MIDLNTVIPANSSLLLLDATYINDRGEIAGHGLTTSGENHASLLIPCGDNDDACQGESTVGLTQEGPGPTIQQPTAATPNPALTRRPGGILRRSFRIVD